MNKKRESLNQRGFSLVEIIITLAVTSIVVMMAGQGLIEIARVAFVAQTSADEWRADQSLAHSLENYFSRARDVDWKNSSINNINSGRGKIRIFKSGFVNSNNNNQFITLAAFFREAGTPNPTSPTSDLRATGIYFKNPSIKSPGELVISSSEAGFGTIELSSTRPTVVYDSIVELEIKPGTAISGSGDSVRMVHVRLITRRFTTSLEQDWRWCPTAQVNTISSCQSPARYIDTSQNLFILLANNSIRNDFGEAESLYGDIYFFQATGGK